MLFLICLVINIKVLRLQYFYDIITTYKGVMDLSFTYKPLWKLLIDKEMTKKQLMEETNISKSTMDKMGRNEKVSMKILDCVLIFHAMFPILLNILTRLKSNELYRIQIFAS